MSLVALYYYYCAVLRSTPGPFSVSASASAESLPASTAGDVCPGVGPRPRRWLHVYRRRSHIHALRPPPLPFPSNPPLEPGPSAFTTYVLPSTFFSKLETSSPLFLRGSIHVASQTLRRLAKLNAPAQYIWLKTIDIHASQSKHSTDAKRKSPPRT